MNNTQIVENIKMLCRLKGITQKKMLSDVGLNANYVNQLSAGKNISAESLIKIAEYLEVTIDWIVTRKDRSQLNKILYLLYYSGKSEKEFTTKIGEPENIITDWKSGKSLSFLDKLSVIADALDVTVYDIMNPHTTSHGIPLSGLNSEAYAPARLLTDMEKELLRVFHFIDMKQKIELLTAAYEMEKAKPKYIPIETE